MNTTGARSVAHCNFCGGYFDGPHYCPGHMPPIGLGAFVQVPLTESRVREIVREELARAAAERDAT